MEFWLGSLLPVGRETVIEAPGAKSPSGTTCPPYAWTTIPTIGTADTFDMLPAIVPDAVMTRSPRSALKPDVDVLSDTARADQLVMAGNPTLPLRSSTRTNLDGL